MPDPPTLRCPAGHVNVADETAAVCTTCGQKLNKVCSNGHLSPITAKFCPLCGETMLGQAPKPPPTSIKGQTAGTVADDPDPKLPGLSAQPALISVPLDSDPYSAAAPSTASQTGRRVWALVGAGAVALALVVGIAVAATSGGSKTPPGSSSPPTAQTGSSGQGSANSSSGGSQSNSGTSGNTGNGSSSGSTTNTGNTGNNSPNSTLASGLVPVDTSAVSSNPDAAQVALTFETYFGGIDDQNWDLAYSAYSPQYQSQVTEPSFESADGSSTDTNAAITSLSPGPFGSTIADVSFQSAQAADAGPVPGETCTNWTLVYTLVPVTSGNLTLLINAAGLNGPGHVGCPGQP